MGVLLDKTRRLTFNEALDLLISEYRERGIENIIIADDLFNMAEEVYRADLANARGRR